MQPLNNSDTLRSPPLQILDAIAGALDILPFHCVLSPNILTSALNPPSLSSCPVREAYIEYRLTDEARSCRSTVYQCSLPSVCLA